MYKLSGATLIIIMSSYYGFYLGHQLKERIKVIDAYIYSLDYIRSQIIYGLTPLPQICDELSHSVNNKTVNTMYKNVYMKLTDIMQKEDTFNEIWQTEMDMLNMNKNGVLKNEEIDVLKELGQFNTYIDVSMQIKCVDNVEYKLKSIYKRLQSEIKTKSRIYQVSGIMAGIVITIILI